jgi:hypothetical protein
MREVLGIYLTRMGTERQVLAVDNPLIINNNLVEGATYKVTYRLLNKEASIVGKFFAETEKRKSMIFQDLSRKREVSHRENGTEYVLIVIPSQNILSIEIPSVNK